MWLFLLYSSMPKEPASERRWQGGGGEQSIDTGLYLPQYQIHASYSLQQQNNMLKVTKDNDGTHTPMKNFVFS